MTGRRPRLLADEMLGKLARDLRALGYDVAYQTDVTDDELLERAQQEARLLLTRDQQLARRAGDQALLLTSRDPDEQLEATLHALDLTPAPEAFLTRCLVCNHALEPVEDPEALGDELPEDVQGKPIWGCPGCARVYWHGSHVEDMRERLGGYLDG